MTLLTPFARCTYCGTISGVMRQTEAREGDWLDILARACRCSATPAELEPITEDDARPLVPHGAVLAIVLVPDDWPGK